MKSQLAYWLDLGPGTKKIVNDMGEDLRKSMRIYLGKGFPTVYFTRREAECVYYLLRRKKRREIAQQLGLSIRTIEFYINVAKAKVSTKSQRKFVDIVMKTEFLPNYLAWYHQFQKNLEKT